MVKKIIAVILLITILFVSGIKAEQELHIRVGTYENKPKIYTDENDRVTGLWGDLTNYIAGRENWHIDWVHGSWHQCLEWLENHKIDMMVDVAYNKERNKRFSFHKQTVLLSWEVLYVHESTNFQSLFDLEGKKIAGLKGSINFLEPEGLRYLTEKFGIDCHFVEKKNYEDAFEELDKQNVYAAVTNHYFGNKHKAEYNIKKTPLVFQPVKLHYAFPKKGKLTPLLIKKIDQHITELKSDKNSIYHDLINEHLGITEMITVFPEWIKLILAIFISFAILFIIFIIILKQQVSQKTKELRQNLEKRKEAEEKLDKYRKHLEELVKERTRKLEEAQKKLIEKQRLATLGKFAGSISHEIKNPLAVIDSSVVNLQLKDLKQADLDKHLKRIRRAVKKSEKVINSLRNLTKNQQPNLVNLNLNKLIKNIQKKEELNSKIELVLDLDPIDLIIEGDKLQCKICLDNLIRNAVDAIEDKGEIVVHTKLIENNKCQIIVEDTGMGIPEEKIDKIFEPLYSSKAFGIGFGLPLAKQIVEAHNGTIEVRSKQGVGTKVIIILPLS